MMDLGPEQFAKLLSGDRGIEELMLQPVFENETGYYSQAELLADVVNILRMDAKRLAALHGLNVTIRKMTPEKMAQMLAEMVDGDTQELIGVFNDLEDHHHDILDQQLDEDEFAAYLEFKETQLYTVQPGSEKPDPEEIRADLDERLASAADQDLAIDVDKETDDDDQEDEEPVPAAHAEADADQDQEDGDQDQEDEEPEPADQDASAEAEEGEA